MCGRARCTLRPDDIPRACHVDGGSVRSLHMDRYRPSFNVSPGSNLPVVRRGDGPSGTDSEGGAVLHCMKWGLVPSFTKKTDKPDHFKMFNARSESIGEKASFRRLIPKNRCLVAVEGFYEWKKDGAKKQPYYIHLSDDRPLVFAALYDSWKNPDEEILYTFTILTTSSSSALSWLHDRMPVILAGKESTEMWFNGTPSKLDMVLKPYEGPDLVWRPVTPAMGKPSFDGPECIMEVKPKTQEKNSISRFFPVKGQNLNTQVTSSVKESRNRSSPERMKQEEIDTKDGIVHSSFTAQGSKSSRHSNAVVLPTEGAIKRERDHEEFTVDVKPTDKTKEASASPAKKKANLKNASDKQPTMLSYFGKKWLTH
ncbi:SOS response associated peptidase (SRAP) [Dillenia turbinata]|uniref:SOS response associated peptidase (SRAP) n=1 Tax=Dillenia turbinata TaxID=194707 RepID=A0AAN8VUS3_9MAGN